MQYLKYIKVLHVKSLRKFIKLSIIYIYNKIGDKYMNNKRLQFIYSPKFNEKGIIIRSLFFLIFDVIIIKLLFTYSNLKNVIFYINLRLTFTTVFYLIRMIKYFFVFIKHRLDVFIIRSNTELQDDLYKDYNLIKDLIDNSIKDIILAVEFFVLIYLFSYACSIYKLSLIHI